MGPMKIWRQEGGLLDQVECRARILPASADARLASTTHPASTTTSNLAQRKMAARLSVGAGATGSALWRQGSSPMGLKHW